MEEASAWFAELIMCLPQKYRRMPATHMVQPHERGKNLPGTVFVVGDKRPVGSVCAGHNVTARDIRLAIAGGLHDDRLHRSINMLRLGLEPLGEVKGSLQALVLPRPLKDAGGPSITSRGQQQQRVIQTST